MQLDKDIYYIKDIAILKGCTERTVFRHIEAGLLKTEQDPTSGKHKVKPEDLRVYLGGETSEIKQD